MPTRRVVIGKYNDGVNFGLRASLPGIDALTGDSNDGGFSFDSNWTDIANVIQTGFIAAINAGGAFVSTSISFVDPGYKPFVEFRQLIGGNTVQDDYTLAYNFTGAPAANNPRFGHGVSVGAGIVNCPQFYYPDQAVYVIYKIATATG